MKSWCGFNDSCIAFRLHYCQYYNELAFWFKSRFLQTEFQNAMDRPTNILCSNVKLLSTGTCPLAAIN